MLVRSWNVFHGNAQPPQKRAFLAEAIRLAVTGSPDVVCLQEIPAWGLARLAEWSGMTALPALAARPTLGPVPIPAGLGRRLTRLNHGLFRSAFSGQGNAILVAPTLDVALHEQVVLNPHGFRRQQARWLALDPLARLAWAKERRVCQAARVVLPDGRSALVANLHATSYWPDQRLPDAELLRAAEFARSLARPDELVVLAGDFNVDVARSRTLADLTAAGWGFSAGGPRIDHVLVRGATVTELEVWAEDRRRVDGVLVSDHAPVELEVV
jgi:endonuclease/exonuclease/phosphatase family metal-dependent hydrolase